MNNSLQIKNSINPISISVFILLLIPTIALLNFNLINELTAIAIIVFAIFLAASIKIANQWEKAVVLRMGKYMSRNFYDNPDFR